MTTETRSIGDPVSQAGRVGAFAELRSVELRSVTFTSVPGLPVGPSPIPLITNVSLNITHAEPASPLGYLLTADVVAQLPTGDVLYSMRAEVVSSFEWPSEADLPAPEELDAFGTVSALPMMFPYVRELFGSLTGRSGLPAVTLPPFRLELFKGIEGK
ncbi:MAG: hypothetical protein ACYDGN_01600 [Acidimicrobiales bacterium]